METEPNKRQIDRKLGDEWSEWDGKLDLKSVNVETGKRLFLGLALLSICLMALVIWLGWYLIEPRLRQLSASLTLVAQISTYGLIAIFLIIFLQTILSIVFQRNLLFQVRNTSYSITFLTPLIMAIGKKLGVSYDRMGNSFIKVSNSLIHASQRQIANGKIMILLPRCLRRPIQKQIISIANKYQCLIYTVAGGELARKVIAEHRPAAIIGVACERDLLLGIRDVQHIPVIGIPNQRPEGPCKNTTVDYQKIEEAVQYFLRA
ncbi:MAG: DUF116 domain-containing protein [candidate division KSB1 bacterium]|nr:DUF116 domain-containing protein [candidate division KSB1 bacterium]